MKDNGGPAFPSRDKTTFPHGVVEHETPGATLRDYFAAKALNGMMAALAHPQAIGTYLKPEDAAATAQFAYALADAMLAERTK